MDRIDQWIEREQEDEPEEITASEYDAMMVRLDQIHAWLRHMEPTDPEYELLDRERRTWERLEAICRIVDDRA